jgi:iron complex outermembrane receptor protein
VLLVLRRVSLTALAASCALAAHAQQTDPASAPGVAPAEEEIVITGTVARDRTVLDSPVPIDLLSADDLRTSGTVNAELGQAISAIAPSFAFPRQSNSGTSDHVRAGQLRGLSPDQLLVLVNGKRRHTSAIVNSETKIGRGTAAVDFNTIPLDAVKKVEILRDGAGAQYGSDAIAGVVNVLLDDDPRRSDLEVTLGEHVTHEDAIDKNIRDGQTFTFDGSTGFVLPNEGFLRVGVDIERRSKTNRAGFDQIPFFEDPANSYLAGRRNYTEGDPRTEGWGLWFNGELPFEKVTAYAFGTYGQRDTRQGAAFFRYPIGSSNVLSIYPDGYRPETRADDEDLSLTAGLDWELGAWKLDTSVSYGRDELGFGVDHSLNPSLGTASPTSFDSGTYTVDQLTGNADLTRDFDLGFLPEPVTLLAGFEYRREGFLTEAGDPESYVAGPFQACHPAYDPLNPSTSPPPCSIGAQAGPGLTPADEVRIHRDVFALYLDTATELLPHLLVDVAGRYEHYSDFGSQGTGKLSAAWTIGERVTVRGAVSNSFRAPGIQQLGIADTTTSFGAGSTLLRTRTLPVTDPIARALGARDLKAETSLNGSFGVTLDLDRFTASVDYFHIDVKNRITLSERFFDDGTNTFFVDYVSTLPGGADVQSVRYFANAVDTKTQGVDVVLGYDDQLFGGDLGVDLSFSYAKTDISHYARTPAELISLYSTFRLVGVEETNTLETAAPHWKTILTVDWSNEKLSGLVRFSAFDQTVRVFNFGGGFEPSDHYGAETQLDVEGTYHFSEHVGISLGVANLLDNYPDRSKPVIGFFGNLPYDILSPIGINGRYVYTRLALSF